VIKFGKLGQTDHYYVRTDGEGPDRYFYVDVMIENGEVTHFVIRRLDQFGTKTKLSIDEIRAIVELAKKVGVVRET
jgi:hypothetical protein